MNINLNDAIAILLKEADSAITKTIDPIWQKEIEHFSEICAITSKTHIAFLGTALLAKSVDVKCDAFSVKAGDDSTGAYSARNLAHNVLVPLAPKLGINLGVTGREPLNNQPYFRIKRVSHDIPVRGNSKLALDTLISLLKKINQFKSVKKAHLALRAFIYVRRQYSPQYASFSENSQTLTIDELSKFITDFVKENSEGGKRAQAVAAGLLGVFAGSDRIVSDRINDPDRHLPGDVGIKRTDNPKLWEKVFEVRDKAVKDEDAYLFIQKAMENEVTDIAIICAHSSQLELKINEIRLWAKQRGVFINFFFGWHDLIDQISFWSEKTHLDALREAPQLIYQQLLEIEASEKAVSTWSNFFS